MSDAPAPTAVLREADAGGCRLRELAAGHILEVVALPGSGFALSELAPLAEDGPGSIRAAGPGSGFVVGAATLGPREIADRESTLNGRAYLIDQTHGRVRLELSGASVRGELSRGVAVDLDPAAFPIGRGSEMLFGHIGVHLTRTGPDTFELLVGRSFAQSLWEELTR